MAERVVYHPNDCGCCECDHLNTEPAPRRWYECPHGREWSRCRESHDEPRSGEEWE